MNDKIIRVEGPQGSKDAKSAEAATKEIEDFARKLSKVNNVTPNILRLKDPKSRFITAEDVMREQQSLSLGITIEAQRIKNRTSKVMSSKKDPRILKDLLDNSRQSCPVCSLEMNSPFPMEWIETASIFRCVRCTIEINPFGLDEEPLPEEPTNFGLSAIHDINKDMDTGIEGARQRFPLVSSRKKKKGIFDDLEKRKEDHSIDRQLGKRII